MRTANRFAFLFGIMNLVIGAMSLFSPFVRTDKGRGIFSRFMPRHSRGLINTRPGMLLGGLSAVNPPHAVMHSALGAAGLATRRFSGLSRPYLWINALMFAAVAAMGWAKVGFKPGIHKSMGIALDRHGNVLHTLWGAAALLLALKPNLGQNRMTDRDALRMVEAGLMD